MFECEAFRVFVIVCPGNKKEAKRKCSSVAVGMMVTDVLRIKVALGDFN